MDGGKKYLTTKPPTKNCPKPRERASKNWLKIGLTRPLIFGIGLPSINVANTNDKRGVGKLLHTLIVSLGKKWTAPNGPIDIPKIPDKTAIGNPNLSSWTARLSFLPKIKKKNIARNPKKLINREFEKIKLLFKEKIFNDFRNI